MQRMIKLWIVIVALLPLGSASAQTARDYYDELYKAGGLDHMADEYVCFDDRKDLGTFFIWRKQNTQAVPH